MITASKLRVISTPENSLWQQCIDLTGYSKAELSGSRRFAPLAKARFESYAIFRKAGYSFPQIGEAFDRDHSTIMHGIGRLNNG
jgi:chromosomal replication initiation ATPase DnaA